MIFRIKYLGFLQVLDLYCFSSGSRFLEFSFFLILKGSRISNSGSKNRSKVQIKLLKDCSISPILRRFKDYCLRFPESRIEIKVPKLLLEVPILLFRGSRFQYYCLEVPGSNIIVQRFQVPILLFRGSRLLKCCLVVF